MTGMTTRYETGTTTQERVTGQTTKYNLQECVRQMLANYFADLNGHVTTDLYDMVMETVEQPLLEAVMRYVGGNQSRASDILGINRGTLRKKLKFYGLE
ncbi:MAG: DNA-binding transcriptional regulator Fis [Gammaproteobacteria bacterium]|nr:DNA-binding transcriptional regulator Fis [Gammaproteobacteria bacterium]